MVDSTCQRNHIIVSAATKDTSMVRGLPMQPLKVPAIKGQHGSLVCGRVSQDFVIVITRTPSFQDRCHVVPHPPKLIDQCKGNVLVGI